MSEALAYRGHWRASGEPDERDRIPELVGELSEMAEVEREHEQYFREKVASHPLVRALRP